MDGRVVASPAAAVVGHLSGVQGLWEIAMPSAPVGAQALQNTPGVETADEVEALLLC